MSKQKNFLYTSEIASYIGQNKYDFVTPFERLWKRCDLNSYNRIIKKSKNELTENQLEILKIENEKRLLKDDLETKKITKRQYNLKIKNLDSDISKINEKVSTLESRINEIDLNQEQRLEKIVGQDTIKELKSAEVDTELKRVNIDSILLKMDVSEEVKKTIKKESENYINKTHGTLKEESAIQMYEKKFKVKLNTSQDFYKTCLPISKNSNFDWYIGGKVDGLYIDDQNPENSYIVEVKNRTKSFFSVLRDYEKTQIQLYMYMLDIKMAKLVEKFKDRIRITVIYRDIEYINNILDYVNIFINNFENEFLNNDKLKLEFVSCDNNYKQIFLKKLYLNEILQKERMYIEKKINEQEENCLIDDLD
jgi:hypothetical protein